MRDENTTLRTSRRLPFLRVRCDSKKVNRLKYLTWPIFARILAIPHQLARDITYGNRGRLKGKSIEDINSSGNCTALIMAAIIYWQAKEISRIVKDYTPEEAGIDLSLLTHISPIEWSNVILYGEYKLNRDLVR